MPDKQYRKIGHLLALGTNTKLAKETQDYLIAGLSLAPSDLSGYRVCTHEKVASCVETCLFYAGRGVMKPVKKARLRKTRLLMEDRHEFLRLLRPKKHAQICKQTPKKTCCTPQRPVRPQLGKHL